MIEKGKIAFILTVHENRWVCWTNATELGRFTNTIDGESNFDFLTAITNLKSFLIIMAHQGVDLNDPKLQASIWKMYEHIIYEYLEVHPNLEIF